MNDVQVIEARYIRSLVKQLVLILAWVNAEDIKCNNYESSLKNLKDLERLAVGVGLQRQSLIKQLKEHIQDVIVKKRCRGKRGEQLINDDIKAAAKRLAAKEIGSRVKLPCNLLHYSNRYCKSDEVEHALTVLNRECYRAELMLASKGLVGTSEGPLYTAFEVGISWHHLLDVPYISASSVRGALRHTTILACLSIPSNPQDKLECVENAYRLFGFPPELHSQELQVIRRVLGEYNTKQLLRSLGYSGQAGCLVLTDFMLVKCGKKSICEDSCTIFEPYVITPHYKPTETIRSEYDVEPVPVVHVVLRPGLVFRGCICMSSLSACKDDIVKKLAERLGVKPPTFEKLLHVLLKATAERGIGARVARGFSRYNVSLERVSSA